MVFKETAQALKYQSLKADADKSHKEYMRTSKQEVWEKFLKQEMTLSIYALENEEHIWETS